MCTQINKCSILMLSEGSGHVGSSFLLVRSCYMPNAALDVGKVRQIRDLMYEQSITTAGGIYSTARACTRGLFVAGPLAKYCHMVNSTTAIIALSESNNDRCTANDTEQGLSTMFSLNVLRHRNGNRKRADDRKVS